MKPSELDRLRKLDLRIREIAQDFGLSVVPIDFEVIPSQKMFEVMAYRFPVNFAHWSRGRDYEKQRTIYEHSGMGLPYEVVLNSSPPRAFIMETNPFPVQVLVLAHVYGHVDFFIENQHMAAAPKDILVSAYESARRFRKYEEKYGLSEVEPLIDAGLALEQNVDPDSFIKRETREEKLARLYGSDDVDSERSAVRRRDGFDEFFPKPPKERPSFAELAHKTPLEPERDVLQYIMLNSPKPLQDWEIDILSVIRSQFACLYPNIRTKIIDEGWATYWHMRIMRRLFEEKLLTPEEHGYYTLYHANVTSYNKLNLNPYLVGLRMLEDIEDRWNKGRFGREWQECDDAWEKEHWDRETENGRQKIFEVRRAYTDRMFIEHFLTDDLIDELDLYVYQVQVNPRTNQEEYVIVERRPRVIRQMLKAAHSDMGIPRVMVEDGNHQGERQLYLKHYFEGTTLNSEYLMKTLEHVWYIWGKPVHLETVEVEEEVEEGQPQFPGFPLATHEKKYIVRYRYDGKKHQREVLEPWGSCATCTHDHEHCGHH